jgi:hypothetical protein
LIHGLDRAAETRGMLQASWRRITFRDEFSFGFPASCLFEGQCSIIQNDSFPYSINPLKRTPTLPTKSAPG